MSDQTRKMLDHIWQLQQARRKAQARVRRLVDAEKDALAALEHQSRGLPPVDRELAESVVEREFINAQKILNWLGWKYRPKYKPILEPNYRFAGVYLLRDDSGAVLYVGRSKNMRNRITQHREGKRIPFTQYDCIRVDDPAEMQDLEAVLIQQHRPPFNRTIPRRSA